VLRGEAALQALAVAHDVAPLADCLGDCLGYRLTAKWESATDKPPALQPPVEGVSSAANIVVVPVLPEHHQFVEKLFVPQPAS
jgi:hypothetical protein